MADSRNLTPEQDSQLEMFSQVIAHGRSRESSIRLLQECDWNVEQALQLHYETPEDAIPQASTSASPLAAIAPTPLPLAAAGNGDSPGIFGHIIKAVVGIGVAIFYLLRGFLVERDTTQIRDAQATGSSLRQSLISKYGANLQLPQIHTGTFYQALQQARREAKVLVVYLHGDYSRCTQTFLTEVLANDIIREMLNSNFLFWGSDKPRHVGQLIHAQQYPCFCALLPASVDQIRVIGAVQGNIEVDAAVALLTSCLHEMEIHRSEINARREQQAEDRLLRAEQERELQESLEADRKRQEQERLAVEKQKANERLAEEQRKQQEAEATKFEEKRFKVEARRKRKASEMEQPGPDAQASIRIRLPAGQRVEKKFVKHAKLADVYEWADCLCYLPQNKGQGLSVPERFTLKTSFPTRELTDMDRTIQDLQLPGTVVMLTELDD